MGLFGWSYPPGCNSVPGDEPVFCEVCGLIDDCICPECPICHEQGNPKCYKEHGMIKNKAQQIAYQEFVVADLKQQWQEAEQCLSYLKDEGTNHEHLL